MPISYHLIPSIPMLIWLFKSRAWLKGSKMDLANLDGGVDLARHEAF